MTESSTTRQSVWTRLILIPIIVILIAGSMLMGYASNRFWSARPRDIAFDPEAFQVASSPVPGTQQHDAAAAQADAARQANDPIANYKLALDLIKQDYYGPTVDAKETRQLTYAAIRGMLASLRDQFTSFLDPDEWTQMQATTHGNFEGIGALLEQTTPDHGDIRVVEPIETGPAEKLGIKAGDIITRVDGKSIQGMNLNDVVRLIKGPAGTRVRLGVLRGRTALEFTVTRERVEPPVVKYAMEDPKSRIGHIELTEFNEESMQQLVHALNALQAQGMRALVFDLRGNPGGLLDVAINVSSLFIPEDHSSDLNNVVVYIKEGPGREQARTLRSAEEGIFKPVPLAVLVNGYSASASEIASGAIHDYGVGTIIGERTFGKGLVQTLFPLEDGSALRLTTAVYYPPLHHDINFKRDDQGNKIDGTGGIVPAITVKQPTAWSGFNDKKDDTQLHTALQLLNAELNGMTAAQAVQAVRASP